MTPFDPLDHPHRRRNLLTGRWVLVSPHRAKRPWQGEVGDAAPRGGPSYDPACYLCPGNTRTGGETNPDYAATLVFPNDFPALMPDTPAPNGGDDLFVSAPARGLARVICYSPDHGKTLPDLDTAAVRALIDTWADQTTELAARFDYVQVFENKGAMMGCSSPHPHGQIWASDFVPSELADEDREQAAWHRAHGDALLGEVARRELALGERVVAVNAHWLAVVPFWASWPFEVLLIARDAVARIDDLSDPARDALARMLRAITGRYDALFDCQMPYSMGWHQAPGHSAAPGAWRLHAHFYPPLLRSATVRKFMVGYEMLAEPQRDLTPEVAAARLRDVTPANGAQA
ncbi:UDP-glucose--hexose-1-phosphate uridylyltransferase [Novosphingobium sp. FSW06-99]|uniref:UDP-glucose--hexose-1-phosphate uridylyltransferase n=1 Tax=Novosphingobium sp. FSW06-99 TaxID=1739113 RepID=UPI00076C0BCD|nr:UDP-glucose--hexose-1-phosphate uridylyltransferase [Novosphingobium sp. FSW06-99]KUR75938.1 galactose-1-phosphate uridylyltransferase [Novosphingobium sp. FSW06-99]